MIHVCYTLRDESGHYSKFVGTSMLSMFENTREKITIHLLHDSTLNHENRKKLTQIAYKYDQEIEFYNVDELIPNRIDELKNRLPCLKNFYATIAAMYRLMLPEILPPDITKVIYLDADTIVNLDIKELWQIDLENHPIAAVTEFSCGLSVENVKKVFPLVYQGIIEPENYFNSGMLVIDLEHMYTDGRLNVFEQCLKIFEIEQTRYLDQDILNILFMNNFSKLPARYNRLVFDVKNYASNFETDLHEIFHYNGLDIRPTIEDDLDRLWFKYFLKTPFCTPEAVKNLCTGIRSETNTKIIFWQKIFRASRQKRIGLCVYPENVHALADFFGINEPILNARSSDIIRQISKHIRENSAFIIAVYPDDFETIRDQLISAGFAEDQDFFNGNMFFFDDSLIYGKIIRQM